MNENNNNCYVQHVCKCVGSTLIFLSEKPKNNRVKHNFS